MSGSRLVSAVVEEWEQVKMARAEVRRRKGSSVWQGSQVVG